MKLGRVGSYNCILAAGICWGLTGIFNRTLAASGLSAAQVLFVRCLVPFVLLGLFALATNRAAFRVKLRDLWVFLGSGLVSVTMFGLAYMNAQQQMSLGLAVTLLYTSPIWVMLFSALFFKERITGGKILALVLVAAGAMCTTGVITGSFQATPVGILLGLVAGFGYGMYSIFTRFAYERGYTGLTVTFYTFCFSSIAVGIVADLPGLVALTTTSEIVLWELGMGIVTCLAPYVLYSKGLVVVENGKASILATVEIVVSALTGVLVFGETLSVLNLAGIVLVFGGIVAMNSVHRINS